MGVCGPILIVDDDPAMRELVSCVLGSAGYATIEVSSGEHAMVMAGEHEPALVVLDVRLPGVSGYEVCRQLRERFGQTLPIVFLTGDRTDSHDLVAGLMIGADDYVVKPFNAEEFVARVRRLLVRSETPQAKNGGPSLMVQLTRREQEVLSLLAEGLSQDAIANQLHISPKTVATHIQRILHKLRVHSRAEAVSFAFRQGLVSPDVAAHVFV
jgi:two-component system nitrate/nitrite response regulator NarL